EPVQWGMKPQLFVLLLLAAPMRAIGGEGAAAPALRAVETPAEAARVRPVEAPKRPALEMAAEKAFDAPFRAALDDVVLPNGLVLDRRSDRDTVSCAATGFTAYALALMADRGSADPTEVRAILRSGFRSTLAATPERNRGWLYHFTDATGRPKSWSEVSTIDSAIFYLGFLRAAETLEDAELYSEVRAAVDRVDVEFLLRDGYFLHGLRWFGNAPHFIPYTWDDTSEGVMLYRLFGLPFEPRVVRHDYPLFVYYYPLCFFDDPTYAEHLRKAVAYQIEHYGYTGVTAGDGPHGYQAHDPKLISPLALFALSGLLPEARATLTKYGVDHMVPTYHVGSGWMAPDRVTIDYASAYILMVRPSTVTP
ncbi:MAG TPA: hypothetical protein VF170_09250, partial [Planctomycetaceae bacterium]